MLQFMIILLPFVFSYGDGAISIEITAFAPNLTAEVVFRGTAVDRYLNNNDKVFHRDTWERDVNAHYESLDPGHGYASIVSREGDVKLITYPESYQITEFTTERVTLASEEFINNSSVKAKVNAGITLQIDSTVSNSWLSKTNEPYPPNQDVFYFINLVRNTGGPAVFSYYRSWMAENPHSKTETVGTDAAEVEIAPGKAVVSTLQANKNTLRVKVDYAARLDGFVFFEYKDNLGTETDGEKFIAYVTDFLSEPKSVAAGSEILTIKYYTNIRFSVGDK